MTEQEAYDAARWLHPEAKNFIASEDMYGWTVTCEENGAKVIITPKMLDEADVPTASSDTFPYRFPD
jgi:hypothetical protein